ncbi:MAG: glycerophosphodiester phosphodiesterase [Ilumatobacter sp.]|nr:glycerophosphodiester phosphodiesterase [Ilumatobacter sp.]
MQQRLPSRLDPPITFAHRGARAHLPENTLDAFELALKLGASGLESDVWLTADGEAVLDHDGVVRSGLRKRPIGAVRRGDLPEHIPSLAELLERCGTSYELSLDVKDPAAAEVVRAVIAEHDETMLPRTWLCHPDLERCAEWRESYTEVKVLNSTRLSHLREGPERRAASLAHHGIDGINMHRSDWSGGLVALFHRFERLAFGWDMQFDHQLRTALRMGLDAVYSDHVDIMQEALEEQAGGTSL